MCHFTFLEDKKLLSRIILFLYFLISLYLYVHTLSMFICKHLHASVLFILFYFILGDAYIVD